MNITSNADFAALVLSFATPVEPFRPIATYDRDGDCIEFLSKNDSFKAERIDDLVTVYYSQETGEIIGSLVKDISKFCKSVESALPGLRLIIEDGPVRLEHIFLAKVLSSNFKPKELKTVTYRKLIEVSREEEIEVEGELCLT